MTGEVLQPPKRHLNFAYHHWVERVDCDGHRCGLEVWQWQPRAKMWCKPNDYARGNDHALSDYVYIGLCPTPPFAPEAAEARRAFEALLQGHTWDTIAGKDRDSLERLIREHILSINP